jgi:thioredoxin 1
MSRKILKFHATWCAPCKALSTTMSSMEISLPVEEIDIDVQSDLAAKFGIRGVPTLVVVDGETVIARSIGMKSKEQLAKWISENS